MRFLLISLFFSATTALAQTRQPITTPIDLSEGEIFGGAIVAKIRAAPPDLYTPTVLNGIPQSGVSDLRLQVFLNYTAEGQLGSRNIGEFVPYQKVTVRIENLSTLDPDTTVEFDLVPVVSAEEGWHYASEVRLPPQLLEDDLLADVFRVSVASISLGSVALHSDAQPPSKLFRPASPTDAFTLFDAEVDFSLGRSLPHGSLLPGINLPEEERPQAPPIVWGAALFGLFFFRPLSRRLFLLSLLALSLLACNVEPLFTAVPPFTQLVLVKEAPVSAGGALATVSIEPPDAISFPSAEDAPLPGGNELLQVTQVDIYLQLDLRYAAAVQGGQKKGDFVPYAIVEASIQNLDTDETFETFLTPHVSMKTGYHYGKNISLLNTVGLSETGYSVQVTINPPAMFGDPDFSQEALGASLLSPGLALASDFAPFSQGTLFSLRPVSERAQDAIVLASSFTLLDLADSATP